MLNSPLHSTPCPHLRDPPRILSRLILLTLLLLPRILPPSEPLRELIPHNPSLRVTLAVANRGELLEPLAAFVPLRVGIVLHLVHEPLSSVEVRLAEGVGDVVEIENDGEGDEADERGGYGKRDAGLAVFDVGYGPECLLEFRHCVSRHS